MAGNKYTGEIYKFFEVLGRRVMTMAGYNEEDPLEVAKANFTGLDTVDDKLNAFSNILKELQENFGVTKQLDTDAFIEILNSFKESIEQNAKIKHKQEVLYALKLEILRLFRSKKDLTHDREARQVLANNLHKFTESLINKHNGNEGVGAASFFYVTVSNTGKGLNKEQIKQHLQKDFSLTRRQYLAMRTREGLTSAKKVTGYLANLLAKALLEPIVLGVSLYLRVKGIPNLAEDLVGQQLGQTAGKFVGAVTRRIDTSPIAGTILTGTVHEAARRIVYDQAAELGKKVKEAPGTAFNAAYKKAKSIVSPSKKTKRTQTAPTKTNTKAVRFKKKI